MSRASARRGRAGRASRRPPRPAPALREPQEPSELPIDLERLPEMSVAELRALWAKHMSVPPPALRRLVIRDLAWHAQSRVHGGLDLETQRMLRSAIRRLRSAEARAERPSADADRVRPRVSKARRQVDLPRAARLVRTYRGARHEVTVLGPREFRYRDEVYTSLSEIAWEITGTHWSGPLFFGLSTRASRAAHPNGPNRSSTQGGPG